MKHTKYVTFTQNMFICCILQRTFEERKRGAARKSWINDIDMAAKTSAGIVDGVYQATFQALFNDAEAHGRGKVKLWATYVGCNLGFTTEHYRAADGGQPALIRVRK